MTQRPITRLAGNLAWTRDGTVWATWRLTGLKYGFATDEVKLEAVDAHRDLFRSLRGEFLLTGLIAPEDPGTVVERMISDFDPGQHPDWADECARTLDQLVDEPTTDRLFYLSVPLRLGTARERTRLAVTAAWTQVSDWLQIPRAGASGRHINEVLAVAEDVRRKLPHELEARPVPVAEQIWTAWHAQSRGIDTWVPSPLDEPAATEALTVRAGVSLGEPVLDEGAKTDRTDGAGPRHTNPADRRVLKITTDPHQVSYQSMLMLADVPNGLSTLGSEFLGRLDDCGYAVDWAVRGVVREQREVLKRNKRAGTQQADQADHRSADATAHSKLDRSADDLDEYQAKMVADDLEVEVDATVILACAGPTFEIADEAAVEVQQHFLSQGYKWLRPLGSQIKAWTAMQPGSPVAALVREHRQLAPAESWAVAVPVISSELGDAVGMRLGWNTTSPRWRPMLLDMFGASSRDNSGSVALAGEKGGGKSATMKTIAGHVSSMGGRWLATDGSATGEWVEFADSVAGSCVVDVQEPAVSLDPLRIFDLDTGSRVAQSFLITLLNVAANDPLGRVLAKVLRPAYLTKHSISSLGDLVVHLSSCQIAGAGELADAMGVYIDPDDPRVGTARVLFDPNLAPLDLACRGIVFWTRGIHLPSRDELGNEHQFRTLSVDKIFGRALFALIARLAHEVCFADRSDLALFLCDEFHRITISPEGVRTMTEFIRDDRKNGAAVVIASHDPLADFGDETLQALIPTRIVMRIRDRRLARRALDWFGADPDDAALLETVMKHLSPIGENGVPVERRGECLVRDGSDRYGRAKIELPLQPVRRKACMSTPPERRRNHA